MKRRSSCSQSGCRQARRQTAAIPLASLLTAILFAAGCGNPGSVDPNSPRVPKTVTFNRDIAPIVFKECSPCHRPGQPGPFDLLTYSDFKKRARQIAEVVADRIMPPWLPEPGYGEFKDERLLEPHEINLIQQWVAGGAVEGAAADLPPPPQWPEGWELGEPDLVLTLPEPYTLSESGRDVWRTFVIPAPVAAPRYIRAMEFRPGNKAVHHAAMRLDLTRQSRKRDEEDPGPGFGGITPPETARPPSGHMLNWLPGRTAYQTPGDLAWAFPADADFLVQLHMQPTGKPELIQPTIGFYFTDRPTTRHLFVFPLMVRTIDIPPDVPDYKITDSYTLPVDVQLLWINPHAHYLAKELKGWARLPDGSSRWLFWIKRWNFNWQGDYAYREPMHLPQGTQVWMEYTYDNSTNNPANPHNPPRRVQFGQQSTDEMGELWLQVAARTSRERAVLARHFQFKTFTEMTQYYTHRLQFDPNDVHAHVRLGGAKLGLGDRDNAVVHLERAIELDPNNEEAYLHLGMIRLSEKRYDTAQACFEKILLLNPESHPAHGNLGLLHMNQGRWSLAETHLKEALRLNPHDSIAQENLRRVLRALEAAASPTPANANE